MKKLRLRSKMIATYLVACMIPLLASSLILYWTSAETLETSTRELTRIFSSQFVTEIDGLINDYDQLTKVVLVDSDTLKELKRDSKSVIDEVNRKLLMRKILMRLAMLKPEIQNAALIVDEDYYLYSNVNAGSIDMSALNSQDWYQEVQSSDSLLFLTRLHDRSYYEYDRDALTVTFARKIYDTRGGYLGILLIDLNPNSLITLTNEILLTRNQYNIRICITGEEDRILYDSDAASGIRSWKEVLEQKNDFQEDEKESYYVVSDMTEKCRIKVNTIIPQSTLLLGVNHIQITMIIAVVVCVVVVIFLSTLFASTITKPIVCLQKNMKQVELGIYEKMDPIVSQDEIGELVHNYNHMIVQMKSLIQDVYLAEIKQKNARFQTLQMQINPHMLYNTLESIRMKAILHGDEETAQMIKILAKMFRMTLSKSGMTHRIQDEIEYAQNYLLLQNMRYKGALTLEQYLDQRILESEIIAIVLQPIIENSIEHGFKGYGTQLCICLTGEITDEGNILIRIADNGSGMTSEMAAQMNKKLEIQAKDITLDEEETNGASIGLKNIAERIRIHYGDGYYLRISSANEKGIEVEMCIPGIWK